MGKLTSDSRVPAAALVDQQQAQGIHGIMSVGFWFLPIWGAFYMSNNSTVYINCQY